MAAPTPYAPKEAIPSPQGWTEPGFENVLDVYRKQFEEGIERGSSFAAYYKGRPVVHIWGGLSDNEARIPWREYTLGHVYSVSKFVCSVTIGHLVERGLLKFEEKISKYWPEFSQNGKENITLEFYMSNRAGLSGIEENYELSWLRDDPARLSAVLAKQRPLWDIKKHLHGYHPFTYALYLSEIVKRVDPKQRNICQYFHDEIAEPFGIDFFLGTPKEQQYRLARIHTRSDPKRQEDMKKSFRGDPYIGTVVAPSDWDYTGLKLSDPEFISLPFGSAGGRATALGMAKLSGILANGGVHEGKRLLTQATLDKLSTVTSAGSVGYEIAYSWADLIGHGALLVQVFEGDKEWRLAGHAGLGDQQMLVDSENKVSVGYVTTYSDPTIAPPLEVCKWKPLMKAVYESVYKLENRESELAGRIYAFTNEDYNREMEKFKKRTERK